MPNLPNKRLHSPTPGSEWMLREDITESLVVRVVPLCTRVSGLNFGGDCSFNSGYIQSGQARSIRRCLHLNLCGSA